jgi:glycosyltransferase involved in cell wall biosynthesis
MRIIYEYKQHYSFIHIYQNDVRLGYTANFLSAINKATGDYIAISDQDDIWELDKIEK